MHTSILLFLPIILIPLFGIKRNTDVDEHTLLNREYTDIVRGIAMLAILIDHIYIVFGILNEGLSATINFLFYQLAEIGVGLFFFLSGYGNYYSIKKNVTAKWLINKISRFYIIVAPLIVLQWLFLVHFNFSEFLARISHIVGDVAFLGFSGYLWYLKIQVLCYIGLFICFKYFNRNWLKSLFIFCIIISIIEQLFFNRHMVILCLCFPLGCLVAMYKEKFQQLFSTNFVLKSLLLVVLTITSIILDSLLHDRCIMLLITSFIACMITVQISLECNVKNRILKYMGVYSLEIYVIHAILVTCVKDLKIPYNISVQILTFIIITFILAPYVNKLTNIKFINKSQKES